MNRRRFLAGLGALIGGLAIEEAIPLGRAWSFPSKIVLPEVVPAVAMTVGGNSFLTVSYINREVLRILQKNLKFMAHGDMDFLAGDRWPELGTDITIRQPEKFALA